MNPTQAFELLVEANPVPPTRYPEMAFRLTDLRASLDLDRARRDRRRPLRLTRLAIAAVIAVVAVLLVSSAFGLRILPLDFFGSPKAPQRVVRDFTALSAGAPVGMDPEVIAGETRQVERIQLSDGNHTLSVAPTRLGGFCFVWSDAAGGCDRLGTSPLSLVEGGTGRVVIGAVATRYVSAVEVRRSDGTAVRPPVVWVSKPIDAGFFVYEVAPPDVAAGLGVVSVAALDADGNVITEQALGPGGEQTGVPSDALVSEAATVLSVETPHGDASILKAPTRYDGTCAWLEFEGRVFRFVPACEPNGYDWNEGLISRFYSTSDAVLLAGTAADPYAEIDLLFQDGDVRRIVPKDHFFVASVAAEHFLSGHRVAAVVARDAKGGEISSSRYVPAASGPCDDVVPHATNGGKCRS